MRLCHNAHKAYSNYSSGPHCPGICSVFENVALTLYMKSFGHLYIVENASSLMRKSIIENTLQQKTTLLSYEQDMKENISENQTTPNHNGTEYITFISVISAVFVLILHCNGCFWTFSASDSYWVSANVIECVFYPAVPLFFMISGITLMDFFDRYTLEDYFVKRIRKTVIPFVVWSLIGLLEKRSLHWVFTAPMGISFIYQGITGTQFVSIYWFFTSLFILYLSLPLFAAVEKGKRKSVFTYLVIAGFALNIFMPFIKNVFSTGLNTPYKVIAASDVLIWIPLGWLLHYCELGKKAKAVIYVLAISGLLMHIIGTYVLSMQSGKIVGTYKGYENVPSVLYSAGMFIFLKDIGQKVMRGNGRRFFLWLGAYTFPIYLMQFILLDYLPRLSFVNTYSMVYRLGAPFVIIPIIIVVTWCMRKVPILRWIVP